MGHFLETTNPEAVDRLNGIMETPDVGTRVVFVARQGMQRAGRGEFPADVLAAREDGSLTLLVQYDANEAIVEERINKQTDSQQHHCWRHIRGVALLTDYSISDVEVGAVEDRRPGEGVMEGSVAGAIPDPEDQPTLTALSERLDTLHEIVLADYEAPPKSIMDHLADFDKRLTAMEKGGKTKVAKSAKPKGGKPARKR